jgi:hypothetical protein
VRQLKSRIHGGAGVDFAAFALQDSTYLGEQGLTELVVMQAFAKLQPRGGVRDGFAPKVPLQDRQLNPCWMT